MGNVIDAGDIFLGKQFNHAAAAAYFELPEDHPAIHKLAVILCAHLLVEELEAEADTQADQLRDELARLTTERDAAIARAERAERVVQKKLWDAINAYAISCGGVTSDARMRAASAAESALVEACEGGRDGE